MLATAVTTVTVGALLAWSASVLGARSVGFAFLVVWLPMTGTGVLSRFVRPRLPQRVHRLRRFERDARLYELLGVRVVKAMLRRGPLAVFNPHLHLPAERSAAALGELDQRMRDAEAGHTLVLLVTLLAVVHAAARGWWAGAGWILLFDVLVNGYPVMLQRYNRAMLRRRFGGPAVG